MKNNGSKSPSPAALLPKCLTGIQGLDEITGGGLPRGRPTLVCAKRVVLDTLEALFAGLTQGGHALQQSEAGMSSLMDSWLLFQDFEGNGERNRVLYVLKARGMAHSNQIREFLISNHGVDFVDAYIGPSGVLTGSARAAQTALEKAEALASQQEAARRKRELERKREVLERQIGGLRSEHEASAEELRRIDEQVGTSTLMLNSERAASSRLRQADAASTGRSSRNGGENR